MHDVRSSWAAGVTLAVGAAGAAVAAERIGARRIVSGVLAASPTPALIAFSVMCLAMASRAVSWRAILSAALPEAHVRLFPVLRATSIGVLLSATVPGRVGEPARAMVMARSLRGGTAAASVLPRVLGTLVSQTILNLLALLGLGLLTLSTTSLHSGAATLVSGTIVPVVLVLGAVVVGPMAVRLVRRRWHGRLAQRVEAASRQVRVGLLVFRSPAHAIPAVAAQLGAWGLQWLACYALLVAFGLEHRAGAGGAAAVLFAVNVSAAVPVTPSNIGVFQASCVAVLSGAYGIGSADALAYGIVLQAVEIASAIAMGAPALIREGMGWRDLRLRPAAVADISTRAPAPEARCGRR